MTLDGGRTLEGLVLNRSAIDMQLLGDDQTLHLLRKNGNAYRQVTSQTDWTSYNGQASGSRYSPLTQITKGNASKLTPKWIFSLPNTAPLQVTPVVAGGVMYVTSANECYALDAGTGRQIWRYQRPRTKGLIGNAAGGANRGVSVAGDQVFMVTDHAHLIALDRTTGALRWDTEMADWRQNYNATGAPLPVGNLVVTGTSGGDEGVRGFLAAFDQATGKEVWRFWTVPKRGEPGSETWQGKGIDHPGGTTWLTGDLRSRARYASTGRSATPAPISSATIASATTSTPIRSSRSTRRPAGSSGTSSSRRTTSGTTTRRRRRRSWTPPGRDSRESCSCRPTATASSTCSIAPTARSCSGKQYVKNVTWATGLDAEGPAQRGAEHGADARRPPRVPVARRRVELVLDVLQPGTNLYYVQTNDKCGIFTKTPMDWEAGKGFMGGSFRPAPEPAQRILRAIDIQTGQRRLGAAAAGRRELVGRRAQHGRRRRDLRRGQRRADGCRRLDGQAALELPDQPGVEGVADDLHVRQRPVRGRRRRVEHHRVRSAVVNDDLSRSHEGHEIGLA